MTRDDLKRDILNNFSEEDWEKLRLNLFPVPISVFNRQTLLRLHDDPIPDPDRGISDEQLSELSDALARYLDIYMPEQPEAHAPIVFSCLALVFIYEEPMHPQAIVKWHIGFRGDHAVYYCPAREESPESLCRFCVCHGRIRPAAFRISVSFY